jgi:hypothetical protein
METYAVALRTSCTRAYLCRPVELVALHLGRHSTFSSEKPPGLFTLTTAAALQIKHRSLPSLSNFFGVESCSGQALELHEPRSEI